MAIDGVQGGDGCLVPLPDGNHTIGVLAKRDGSVA